MLRFASTILIQAGYNQLSLSLYGYAKGIYSLVITRNNKHD
jgi:hypothetical protein